MLGTNTEGYILIDRAERSPVDVSREQTMTAFYSVELR